MNLQDRFEGELRFAVDVIIIIIIVKVTFTGES
jgi:hypothetical protein